MTTTTMTPTTSPAPPAAPQWVLVTPEIAREWLEHNPANRKLRPSTIAQYAKLMKSGNWTPESSALIQRGPDGALLNGQHRMHAVIRSNTPVYMLLLDNVPAAARLNMDIGPKRTFAEHLAMTGRSNGKLLSALSRWVTVWENGERMSMWGPDQVVSYVDQEETLERHPELAEAAAFASRRRMAVAPSVVAMAYWLFSTIDAEECEEFLGRVYDGVELSADHPAYALRERLDKDRINRRKAPQREALALFIIAWNAYRERRPLQRVQLPKGGLKTSNYPVPV